MYGAASVLWKMISPRPLILSFVLVLASVAGGLLVRLVPLGLPPVLVKYGGSILWASMIYWLFSALCCSWSPGAAGLLAGFIATSIECFKLYHSPILDAFRFTLPGALLLGRIFSVWDIVVYWLAMLAGVWIDTLIRSRPGSLSS